MARARNLRYNVINQMMEAISSGHITSPLPSQSILADMYSISRTTVRHTLDYLETKEIIHKSGSHYIIARMPQSEDEFTIISERPQEQLATLEQAFYRMIHQRKLSPGDLFTELALAKQVNVSPLVVREFLLRFSRYNLIKNVRRGQWSMMQFDRHYAEKLFELRELLEMHALTHFMTLPETDNRWNQARDLLWRHRLLRENVILNYREFSLLDHQFHNLLISAADNPFFDQSSEAITVIFHFHYQWDERDLKVRNILAIEEHMAILAMMLGHNDQGAMNELRKHLETAKQSMFRSTHPN